MALMYDLSVIYLIKKNIKKGMERNATKTLLFQVFTVVRALDGSSDYGAHVATE